MNRNFVTKADVISEGETVASGKTTNGVQKTANVETKSADKKNVILVLDLSGSMNKGIDGEDEPSKGNAQIDKMKIAAKKFISKLDSKTTNVTLVGIGCATYEELKGFPPFLWYEKETLNKHIDGTEREWSPYDDVDAFVISTYNEKNWNSITSDIDDLRGYGGTNITGAMDIVADILTNANYRSKYKIEYSTEENARSYVTLLTDGANGPKAKDRITGNEKGVKTTRENADELFAIAFGKDVISETSDGYKDLKAIVEDTDKIYQASDEMALNGAFDAIANRIVSSQSVNGIIEAKIPADGQYFPIIITYKDSKDNEHKERIDTLFELDENKEISIKGDKLEWNLSGGKYSDKKDVKLSLTLTKDATDGKTYDVEWKDGNGTVLKTERYTNGEKPTYSGDEPSKPASGEEGYVWSGEWKCEKDTTNGIKYIYTAKFIQPTNVLMTMAKIVSEINEIEQISGDTEPAISESGDVNVENPVSGDTEKVEEPLENSGDTEKVEETVENSGDTEKVEEPVENSGDTEKVEETMENSGDTEKVEETVENSGDTEKVEETVENSGDTDKSEKTPITSEDNETILETVINTAPEAILPEQVITEEKKDDDTAA